MENKLLNSLILVLVISTMALAYYFINQSSQGYFSFTVSSVEIGKYSSYKECIEDEKSYNHVKLADTTFSYENGNCDWHQ